MEVLNQLAHINWWTVFLAIVAALLAFKFLCELGGWFVKKSVNSSCLIPIVLA